MEDKVRTVTAVVAVAIFIAVAAPAQSQFCTANHSPDVVRITLSSNCKAPGSVDVRRNGDDTNRLNATPDGTGAWQIPKFSESIGSVVLCSRVCGFASACVRGVPKQERDRAGNNVCVAEYSFKCDESAWTLAVQAKPPTVLSYTRKREGQEQRGRLNVSALKTEVCDLAADETVNLIPHTKKTYSFKPIPVSYDTLDEQEGKALTLGAAKLMDYVIPPKSDRARPATANEAQFVILDIKELKLMIAPEQER